MKIRTKQIDLFGMNVLISERTFDDSSGTDDFVASKNDIDSQSGIIARIRIIQDALKINFRLLKWYKILTRLKFKRRFSTKNFSKNLSLSQIIGLSNMVLEELEGLDISSKKKDESTISRTYQLVLVAEKANISIFQAGQLPVTLFSEIFELAFSYGNFLRGGDFILESHIDKRFKLINEHKKLFPEAWNN